MQVMMDLRAWDKVWGVEFASKNSRVSDVNILGKDETKVERDDNQEDFHCVNLTPSGVY